MESNNLHIINMNKRNNDKFITFTDGSTLKKYNSIWIEQTTENLYTYNEVNTNNDECRFHDYSRNITGKIDENDNFWIT